jgi:hypothetical protein
MYNLNIKRNLNNRNVLIDLEKLKGSNINNMIQYNNAIQRQLLQNEQKNHILKYTNNQFHSELVTIKSIQIINYCDSC